MLETHSEIGYLLVILVALIVYCGVVFIAIVRFPVDDVYLVPGVEACGVADIAWGANPPTPVDAVKKTEEAGAIHADLGAAATLDAKPPTTEALAPTPTSAQPGTSPTPAPQAEAGK